MFKKLFGKKKSTKPQSLADAKAELIENISEESSNRHVADSFNHCLDFLTDAPKEEVDSFANSILELTDTLPVAQAALALSICTSLIERGYRNEDFIEKIVDLYSKSLKDGMPFFVLLNKEVKKGEEGDSEIDVDVDTLYTELLKDRSLISESVATAVLKVEHFSQYMISILSIDSSLLDKYKSKLKDDIFFIKDYIQACYWVNRLFNMLFSEPVLVIDVDNHLGIEAIMSGVSDNFQLQHLLMGIPELNNQKAISDQDLAVVNGTGIHISNSIVESKWNMYNREIIDQEDWQDIKVGPAKTHELQDFWIWGEGTPLEISVHNGRRVILLGRSSYKRQSRIQRVFKNMKASIEVEKVLTDEEINSWLGIDK